MALLSGGPGMVHLWVVVGIFHNKQVRNTLPNHFSNSMLFGKHLLFSAKGEHKKSIDH